MTTEKIDVSDVPTADQSTAKIDVSDVPTAAPATPPATVSGYKKGVTVYFEHCGRNIKGEILEDEPIDGKYRIRSWDGYYYRIPKAEIAFSKPSDDTTTASSNNNINQTSDTMAKKNQAKADASKKPAQQKTAPATTSAPTTNVDPALIKRIKELEAKKHQRIFLLMEAGCDRATIKATAGCNDGEIYNVKKSYGESKDKVAAAKALLG